MSQTTPPLFFNAEWLSMQQRFWENTFKFNPQQPAMPDVLGLWNGVLDNMRKQMSGWIESPLQKVETDAQNFSKLFEQFQSYMQQFPTWQNQFQTGAQLWQNHQQAQQAALQMVQKIGSRAISLLNQRLEELSNQQPLPPQALYTAWVESGEEAYAEFVSTEDYSKITGELINSWLAWRHNGRIALDEMLASLHLPTYAQTQKLQTKLAELRSQQAALQHADNTAEIDSLNSEISRLQNIISELQTAKATPVEIVVEKPVEVIVEKVVEKIVEKTNDAEIMRLQKMIAELEETVKAKPTEVVKEVMVEKIVEKINDAEIVSLNAEIARLQGIIAELQTKTATVETHTEIHIEEPVVKKKTTRKTTSSRSTTSFKTR